MTPLRAIRARPRESGHVVILAAGLTERDQNDIKASWSGPEGNCMFIAMNRFQVKTGSEQAFEQVWANRESYLGNVAGFVEFNLLKGPVYEDHTLYSSHTKWSNKSAFEAWTRSDEFRRAHARAGNNSAGASLYLGHPKFEGFEVIQSEPRPAALT